jgi:nucleoside-diphosphate-sugar epimerase
MKICVTGGSGFIGSRLIEEFLRDQHEVINIDRRQSPFFPDFTHVADIRNKKALDIALSGADLVVHLAAEHRDDVSPVKLYYDVNVNGTQMVINGMVDHGVNSIIFTSSVAIYGLNKTNPAEDSDANPFNHYGKSKWEAEEIIKKWQRKDNLRSALIIRPAVVFGERNRGNVFNLFRQIATGRFLKVGQGKNKKSMAYVGNLTAFMRHFVNKGFSGLNIYNYADKPDLSINELVEIITKKLDKKLPPVRVPYTFGLAMGYGFDLIAKIIKKPLPISSVRVKKFCATTQFDSSKAFSNGYCSPYSMQQALEKTLSFEFLTEKKDDILFISE